MLCFSQPGKPSETQYWSLVGALFLFSGIVGYMVAIQPMGEWRFFSWHPFLMTLGMVGFMGVGAVTKKLGGYDNTKVCISRRLKRSRCHCGFGETNESNILLLNPSPMQMHGILGWLGNFLSLAGLYCIYRNKEMNGYDHLKSSHAWCGLGVMINCIGVGMAGGIFLHPDFGIATTNKTLKAVHKWASRLTLIFAWMTAVLGVNQLVGSNDTTTLAMYAVPLAILVPFTLM